MFVIDCGNTRIKWAACGADGRKPGGHASLDEPDAAFAALAAVLASGTGPVIVANVAGPETARRIGQTVESALGVAARFVAVEPKAHGIECAYSDPSALGVDRWLAMIAAKSFVDGPVAVVSAGTAVTFDAADGAGRHLGGLILAGERLMIESLARSTGQIPLVPRAQAEPPADGLLARTTADAVGRGARLAVAAAIDRAIAEVRASVGEDIAVIMTGGDGPDIAKWLASDVELRADLVLDGLAIVAAESG